MSARYGGRDFANIASYLKLGSETELHNIHFNKARNENNTKYIERNRNFTLGKVYLDAVKQSPYSLNIYTTVKKQQQQKTTESVFKI